MDKFEECKFRSKEIYTRKIRICCNNYKDVTAYDCPKREIFPLSSEHCNNCKEFEIKE